jgi:hypothetical protein
MWLSHPKEAQDYRIPPEVITGLPIPPDRLNQASIGIFYGVQDAQLFYVGHIQTSGEMPLVNAARPTHESKSTQARMLDIKDLI